MSERPAFARGPVLAVAGVLGLLLLLLSGRYGYHRDELYFLAAGRHLAWGYPDQPPLTPLLARIMSVVGPDSLVVLRLPSTLSAAAGVAVAGALARELGARRSGQVFAAAAAALSGVLLATGHLLSTVTTDLLGWTVLTFLLVRLLQGGDPRGWLLVGLVSGVTMQANVLVVFLLVAVLVGVLLSGPRDVLRSPWPWMGAALALLLVLPYLIWQADHGWPQLDVARAIADGGSGTSSPRALFVPFQFLVIGPWLTPIWVVGLVQLWRSRRVRCLTVAYGFLVVLFLATGGKPYYLGGLYPLLLAAGAQPLLDARRWLAPVLLLLGTPVLVLTLPLVPAADAGFVLPVNYDAGETIGWPQYVEQIAASRPPGAVVLTENYGEAGAVERFDRDLPVYSGQNAFAEWGPPPETTQTVLAVGYAEPLLHKAFEQVTLAGVLRNREGIDNDENGTRMFVCSGPRQSWGQLWPSFTRLG